jgi:hypothetical protein
MGQNCSKSCGRRSVSCCWAFGYPGAPDTARLAQAQFPGLKVIMLLEDELTRFR